VGEVNFAGADLDGTTIDENFKRESDLWNSVGTPVWVPVVPEVPVTPDAKPADAAPPQPAAPSASSAGPKP